MPNLRLYVGNRNYSSWSLRPWLCLTWSGLAFDTVDVDLDQPGYGHGQIADVLAVSPTGRIPALHVDDLVIWDSLAIAEFMAEIAPAAGLWPEGRMARAKARAVAAEMHSGFAPLRQQFAMEFARHMPGQTPSEGTARAITRIVAVWEECLAASGGPYLFGESFGNADFFYAPVVSRFHSYDVALSGAAKAYADRVWHHPFMREWLKAAAQEVADGVV